MVPFVGLSLSAPLVYLSILVIAVCGIIYELIIGAVSAYLWGDSVLYFSVTIGLYMSAMGLGAFLSKFVRERLFDVFVASEILIGLIGGCSALFLFWIYSLSDWYEIALVGVTVLIGMLVGIEIPLLIRLLESETSLRQNVAHVLTYDYIGGLIGALVFPLLLLPHLGLIRTALVLGLSNLAVAFVNFVRHRHLLKNFYLQLTGSLAVLILLSYALWQAPEIQVALEQRLYRDQVIMTRQTPYQSLTLTQWHDDVRLFINGGLQFSSLDEYRYHESIVHVPMAAVPHARRVLVLGGGDGLAVRELLKYPQIENIQLVDIDPEMTRIFSQEPRLRQLNQNSLSHAKLKIKHLDAYKFAEQDQAFYDLILVDLPDPSHTALSKLYSQGFYELLKRRLSLAGVMVTQSTSPFFAREAYWCIHKTLAAAGFKVLPYQVEVPSFGNWGFQLASNRLLRPEHFRLPAGLALRYLNPETLRSLFVLPEDLKIPLNDIAVSTLSQPVILQYYDRGWNGIR
jgi:spermidine synthase